MAVFPYSPKPGYNTKRVLIALMALAFIGAQSPAGATTIVPKLGVAPVVGPIDSTSTLLAHRARLMAAATQTQPVRRGAQRSGRRVRHSAPICVWCDTAAFRRDDRRGPRARRPCNAQRHPLAACIWMASGLYAQRHQNGLLHSESLRKCLDRTHAHRCLCACEKAFRCRSTRRDARRDVRDCERGSVANAAAPAAIGRALTRAGVRTQPQLLLSLPSRVRDCRCGSAWIHRRCIDESFTWRHTAQGGAFSKADIDAGRSFRAKTSAKNGRPHSQAKCGADGRPNDSAGNGDPHSGASGPDAVSCCRLPNAASETVIPQTKPLGRFGPIEP